jgi:hypothetical protein
LQALLVQSVNEVLDALSHVPFYPEPVPGSRGVI